MGRRRTGFSLIELVIVVVIIAIIGAIAIPRMSRGAAGAGDAALTQDLATFRQAIDHYQAEHGGTLPLLSNIYAQLTLYSDAAGTSAQSNPDSTHLYGPYLRSIPALPVGANKGQTGIGAGNGPTIGWVYDETAGAIHANTITEADAAGVLYSSY
jgi:general secretion pathway protein G